VLTGGATGVMELAQCSKLGLVIAAYDDTSWKAYPESLRMSLPLAGKGMQAHIPS